MARKIDQDLQAIREAVYGEEVRGAIVDGIEQAYLDANDVVKVSDTQPTAENVKLWVKPESDEYKVPTWEEHTTLEDEVEDLKSAIDNSTDYLGAKNLAYTPDKTSNIQGIAIVWTNGTGIINGTTTAVIYYNFTTIALKAGRNYKLNGCIENASLYVLDSNNNIIAQANYGQDVSFTVPSDGTYTLRLRVPSGKTFENVSFAPMVRYAGTSGSFVPYVPTNEELNNKDAEIASSVTSVQTTLQGNIDAAEGNTNQLKTAYNTYIEEKTNKNSVLIADGTATSSGVDITKADGVVTLNGTTTGNIYYVLCNVFLYADKTYILSGSSGQAILQVTNYAADTIITSVNSGNTVSFTVPEDGLYRLRLRISSGKTFDNEALYPMIRESFFLDGAFVEYSKKNNGIAVWFGDSFVQANSLASAGLDQTKRFATLVSNNFGWVEKNYAVGGMGYITGETPYLTQVQNANNDRSYDHNLVTHVFVSGGINDLNTANLETLLYPAVKTVIDTIKTVFPNAQIFVIPLTYYDKNISQIGFWVYKTIASICAEGNAHLIGNAYTWLNGMLDDILTDGVHPNIAGHALIASYIMNALTTGDSFAYPASCAFGVVSSKLDTDTAYYFCTMKHNGKITVNGNFKLNIAATANERLYQYENATTKNNLTYIGRYGKHVPCFNLSTGDSGVLLVSQEETTNGYINYVNAVSPLLAGTWKVMSTDFNIGVQEYCGNKN